MTSKEILGSVTDDASRPAVLYSISALRTSVQGAESPTGTTLETRLPEFESGALMDRSRPRRASGQRKSNFDPVVGGAPRKQAPWPAIFQPCGFGLEQFCGVETMTAWLACPSPMPHFWAD